MNESTIPPAIPGGPDGAEVTSGDGPAMNQMDGNPPGANRGSVISSPEDLAGIIPAVTALPVQIAAAEPLAGGFAPAAAPVLGAGRHAGDKIHPRHKLTSTLTGPSSISTAN